MGELPAQPRVVLASGSPRRREILTTLGVDFEVRPADIDESVVPDEHPIDYVLRLARTKATVVAAGAPDALVIAADTTVVIDRQILGKPADIGEARAMVRRLSGRTHQVHTGVAVALGPCVEVDVVTTDVTFIAVSDDLVEWYVGQSEPYDKAGGYALQGAGAVFVERVDGNVANVIGLPVPALLRLTKAVGRPLI